MKKLSLLLSSLCLSVVTMAQLESQYYNTYYFHDKPSSMMEYNYEADGTTTTDWFNHVFSYDAQGNMIQDEATLTGTFSQKQRNLFEYNSNKQITKATSQEYNFVNSAYTNDYVEEWKYDAYGIDSAYTDYSWFANPPVIVSGSTKQKMTRDANGKILEVNEYDWNSFDEVFRLEEKRTYKYDVSSGNIDSIIIWKYNGTLDKLELTEKWYALSFAEYNDIDFTKLRLSSYKTDYIVLGGTERHDITYNSNKDKLSEQIFQGTDTDPSNVISWTYSSISITKITQYWSGGGLVNNIKSVTLLDDNGINTGEESYDWDSSTSDWVLDYKSRTVRTFASGKMTQEILQDWDYTNNAWVNKEKRVYSYTNSPTAIMTPGFEPGIRLYPNPATDEVQLSDLKDVVSIEVISSTAVSYAVENSQRIELKGPSGLYLVKVRFTNDRYYTYKIIKQ